MGDIAVENCAVYPYWVRCGRVRYILTEDVALEYGAVDIYWGRCATEWHCRYLVGALR